MYLDEQIINGPKRSTKKQGSRKSILKWCSSVEKRYFSDIAQNTFNVSILENLDRFLMWCWEFRGMNFRAMNDIERASVEEGYYTLFLDLRPELNVLIQKDETKYVDYQLYFAQNDLKFLKYRRIRMELDLGLITMSETILGIPATTLFRLETEYVFSEYIISRMNSRYTNTKKTQKLLNETITQLETQKDVISRMRPPMPQLQSEIKFWGTSLTSFLEIMLGEFSRRFEVSIWLTFGASLRFDHERYIKLTAFQNLMFYTAMDIRMLMKNESMCVEDAGIVSDLILQVLDSYGKHKDEMARVVEYEKSEGNTLTGLSLSELGQVIENVEDDVMNSFRELKKVYKVQMRRLADETGVSVESATSLLRSIINADMLMVRNEYQNAKKRKDIAVSQSYKIYDLVYGVDKMLIQLFTGNTKENVLRYISTRILLLPIYNEKKVMKIQNELIRIEQIGLGAVGLGGLVSMFNEFVVSLLKQKGQK
jgi:hypothetical protein